VVKIEQTTALFNLVALSPSFSGLILAKGFGG
jgi:hypothetical protein